MTLAILSISLLLVAGPAAAAGPEDLDKSFEAVQQAEAKKDAAELKKAAADTFAAINAILAQPAPSGEVEKENWTKRTTYAKEVAVRSEYALYAVGLASPAATQIDLFSTLEHLSPKSKYLDNAYATYFYALHQTGGAAKIPAIAEKALANFPDNEDLLLVAAESAMSKRQPDRALTLANRLITTLAKHPKPEGYSAAEWEKKKAATLARGSWIAGVIQGEKNQYFDANRNLRTALSGIQGNNAMLGPALFHLGVANYQLGRMTNNKAQVIEAIKFSEQASQIAGPLSQQAWRNAQVMRTEVSRMR
jgi:hypothetical protein